MQYYFTDGEINSLLKTLVILVDTREQKSEHITAYFDKMNISYKQRALDCGDYSFMLPAMETSGLLKDIHFSGVFSIERKANLTELSNNLTQERQRIESEFMKSILSLKKN